MPTLSSLKLFLTAVVTRIYYGIFSRTSVPAKASGTSNTPASTLAPSSSTEAPGRRRRFKRVTATPSTPTTSDATLRGLSTLWDEADAVQEAPEAGRTAGTPGTSHDCRMWKAGLTMLANVANGNRASCESGCVMCGTRWFLVLRGHVEARN